MASVGGACSQLRIEASRMCGGADSERRQAGWLQHVYAGSQGFLQATESERSAPN